MNKKLLLALSLFLIVAQARWGLPAPAQSQNAFFAHVTVYVNNKADGSPVPGRAVYLTDLGQSNSQGATRTQKALSGVLSQDTSLDGAALA